METKIKIKAVGYDGYKVDCKYVAVVDDEGVISESIRRLVDTRIPRGAFIEVFDAYSGIASRMLGVDTAKVNVSEIRFSGKDDSEGVIFKGKLDTEFGGAKFTTPRLKYQISESAEAADTTVEVTRLYDEVKRYLDGESADLEEL